MGPETDRRQLAAIRAAARAGRRIRTELRGHRKDGSHVWVETEISTLADAGGVPTHWIAIQRDITRRRADERALAERNRAFRLIFEDNPLPICIYDETTLRFLEVNAAAVRHVRLEPGRIPRPAPSRTCARPSSARASSRELAAARRRLSGGWARCATSPGPARCCMCRPPRSRSAGRGGAPASRWSADITELRRAQEALLQSERLSTIGQITGGVAHDFNNLLTVVMLNLGDALAEVPPGSALHGMLDSALYAASRGAELTSQLLSYARRQTLRPQVVGLHEQLSPPGAAAAARARRPRHQLETAFGGAETTVNVDPVQLETAVMNLVLNARDALPEGGRIMLGVARRTVDSPLPALPDPIAPGRYAAVFVEDAGRGIPEAAQRRVFDPFFTTKPAGEGSGLGLSMVYGFVRQSGGHVDLRSRPGSGTRVDLLLPEIDAPVTPVRAAGRRRAFRAEGMTVLLVEDQEAVLRVVSRHFAGTRLPGAGGGQRRGGAAAAARRRADRPAVQRRGVCPARMDGAALAGLALTVRPGLRVLLTSGFSARFIGRRRAVQPVPQALPAP